MGKDDILIKILSQYDNIGVVQAERSISKLDKKIINMYGLQDKYSAKSSAAFSNLFRPEVMSRTVKDTNNYYKSSSKLFELFGKRRMPKDAFMLQKDGAKYWDNYMKNTAGAVRVTDKLTGKTRDLNLVQQEILKKGQKPFAGYALSIMFAGMAIQRTFSSIRKFGVSTFQEINKSIEGTTTNADLLDGSMKYLGYTVGSALEPLMATLIPVVDALAKWADDNPKLVSEIVELGSAIGGLMLAFGGYTLAKNGLAELSGMLGEGGLFSTSVGDASSKVNKFKGALNGIARAITVMLAVKFAKDAVKDLIKGDFYNAIANGFLSAGLGVLTWNPEVGLALLTIGITMKFVESDIFHSVSDWFWKNVRNPIMDAITDIQQAWNSFIASIQNRGLLGAFINALHPQKPGIIIDMNTHMMTTPALASQYENQLRIDNRNELIAERQKAHDAEVAKEKAQKAADDARKELATRINQRMRAGMQILNLTDLKMAYSQNLLGNEQISQLQDLYRASNTSISAPGEDYLNNLTSTPAHNLVVIQNLDARNVTDLQGLLMEIKSQAGI